MYNRILIKLSGEALAGDSTFGFSDINIKRIVSEIKELHKTTQICLVIGGGNFWRGRDKDANTNRARADEIGMLATIMNGIYFADSLKQAGIKSIVMTPFLVGNMTTLYNNELADEYIKNGYIIIFSGGLGHPYFSTDTIASLRSCELSCDCILYAKTIDGVYDGDPKKNENAKKYLNITYDEIIKNNLKVIDIAAMNLCNEQKINSVVFDLNIKNSIIIASKNNDEIYTIGTKVNYN